MNASWITSSARSRWPTAIVVVTNAIHDNGVVMTYLRVPQSFEATGFSSARRLVDFFTLPNLSEEASIQSVESTRMLAALNSAVAFRAGVAID